MNRYVLAVQNAFRSAAACDDVNLGAHEQIDVHFVEELAGRGTSDIEATLVCHTRSSIALEVHNVCSQLHWHACEVRAE